LSLIRVGYGLAYYDKAILGSAVLFGMTKDLSLSVVDTSTHPPTERLSWATSMFYFGMLAGLYPMAFTPQLFNLGKILGAVVIIWVLVCMLTATVASWRGLCPALLLEICGINPPNGLHVYYQRLLHAKWSGSPSILVVLHRPIHHHWKRAELRVCPDYRRSPEAIAIHLSPRWVLGGIIWPVVLRGPELSRFCLVCHTGRARCGSWATTEKPDRGTVSKN